MPWPHQVHPGSAARLGAHPDERGVNFCVYSADAQLIELLLYAHVDDESAAQVVRLQGPAHRTWHYWHAYVEGLQAGQLYAFRAHGSFEPARGLRFDAGKVLLDPYGRAVAQPIRRSRAAAIGPGANDAQAYKSMVARHGGYDWEGDQPLRRPFAQTVIYELHVRGFTRDPSAQAGDPWAGTFAGLTRKIDYLSGLGITAVELMPVFQFDTQDAPPGRTNYWGYMPVSFFAPHLDYGSRAQPQAVIDEFKDMVKALHRHGIEVILDVVFNHTAEGGAQGPTMSLRGLDNASYYLMEPGGRYADYSGCGNTLNANASVVRRLILDSLRYWVQEMHVDGFRFDLASVLSRDAQGQPRTDAAILADIESDPVLAGTKLIAEAWDAAGLNQVGRFVGGRWKEWNGHFRDSVRRFWRADDHQAQVLAQRLLGSPDLYAQQPHEPDRGINFITSHDGFTLQDLVSFNAKHNEANGEDNRDGAADDLSWNCGIEGPSQAEEVVHLRQQQVKNFLCATLLAVGTPMMLMGDEMGRSQGGNNNAYCHDSTLSWLDWTLLQRHGGLHRFVRGLLRLRQFRDAFAGPHPTSLSALMSRLNPQRHGLRCGIPDDEGGNHHLALSLSNLRGDLQMYWALNAAQRVLTFELPNLPSGLTTGWRRVVDTARVSPEDCVDFEEATATPSGFVQVQPHSAVVFLASLAPPTGVLDLERS